MNRYYRYESAPLGVWTAKGLPDFGDEYRWCRSTLRVALQLGRNRAYAAGTWWTFRLVTPWSDVHVNAPREVAA